MNNRILVIDDEMAIRLLLKINLEQQGFHVIEAGTASDGISKAADKHPHLVILDLGLPDGSGLSVLKSLREWTQVPILVLTINDSEVAKVSLLEAGADDYVTKPFSVPELIARIKVALRHQQNNGATPVHKSSDLEIDLARRTVQLKGRLIKLTSTEFAILRMLTLNAGRVVSQEALLTEVWGKHALGNNHYLRIYVGQLRKKIEQDPSQPRHIITEPGVGYRLL